MAFVVTLVALPLGHPEDLSLRGARALREADRIFCEDTRKTRELFTRAGIEPRGRLTAIPGDREREFDWARLQDEDLRQNPDARWALVSDAGTPVVNDPGRGLLAYCRESEIEVRALPGPCAPVLAWQWSGGFGLPFVFAGFAPKAKGTGTKDLRDFFAPLRDSATFVFFDTRHQYETTLEHLIADGGGDRLCHAAREMTKPHEELVSGTVTEVLAALRDRQARQSGALGELTFVLAGAHAARVPGVQAAVTLPESVVTLEDLVQLRRAHVKEASKIAARLTGRASKDCYSAFVDSSGE
jgi:16S rRNA (cytidine1402-2'-O)-methyltransferase